MSFFNVFSPSTHGSDTYTATGYGGTHRREENTTNTSTGYGGTRRREENVTSNRVSSRPCNAPPSCTTERIYTVIRDERPRYFENYYSRPSYSRSYYSPNHVHYSKELTFSEVVVSMMVLAIIVTLSS